MHFRIAAQENGWQEILLAVFVEARKVVAITGGSRLFT